MNAALRLVARAVGGLCLVGAAFGAVMFLWALLDPAGLQMATTGDPFATPPSRARALMGLVFSGLVAWIGAGLSARGAPRDD